MLGNRVLRRGLSTAKKVDYLVMGGGPVGTSIAYHLALNGAKNITVLEQDLTYRTASAMLSAGGIRQQFSVPENVKMQVYGADFLRNKEAFIVDGEVPDLQFHENGYLFLTGEKSEHILKENYKTQHESGCTWIEMLTKEQLEQKFPWLNTDGITMGTFGTKNEGYFDPWLYVSAVKKKAQAMGVEYIEAKAIGGRLSGAAGSYNIDHITAAYTKSPSNTINIQAGNYINSAGAWSGRLVRKLAESISNSASIHAVPVNPRKRCIFNLHCRAETAKAENGKEYPMPPSNTPLVVDPSGAYFRPEIGRTGHFLAGVSPPEDQDPEYNDDKDYEALRNVDYNLFEELIWAPLYDRVPTFQEIKVTSSWAGFYDYNSVDQNAIIGPHSEIKNLMLCTGFSGHGLMQSPAAGRTVTELLLHKKYLTLDLSRFSFERIVANKPIFETGIV